MSGLVVADLVAKLGLDASGFDRGMTGVTGHKGWAEIGKKTADTGKKMTTSITLPVVALTGAAVTMGVKFEESMKLIQTQAGGSAGDVKFLSAEVLKLGAAGQHGPEELSNALYHLKSVGMDNTKAMSALTAAEHLASVGGSDLETTTNAVASAYKSGIKGAQDFNQTAATINATIGAGNLRLEDYVSAMGTGVMVSAKQAGVSLTDVGSAIAMMTSRGIPAVRAATSLKMAFSAMEAPTSKMSSVLSEIGIKQSDLANAMRTGGLPAAVQLLKDHLEGLSKTAQTADLTKMFGAKSSQAILTLIANTQDYAKVQQQITDNATSGKFGEAIAAQAEDAGAKLKHFMAVLQTAGVQFGNVMLPMLSGVVEPLGELVEGFGELSDTQKKWILVAAGTAAAVGPVLIVLGKTAQGVAVAASMYRGLRTAILGATAAQAPAPALGAGAGAGAGAAGAGATAGVGTALAGLATVIPVGAIAAGIAAALVLGVKAGLKQAKEDKAAQLGFWEDFWKTSESMATSGGDWFKNLVDKLAGVDAAEHETAAETAKTLTTIGNAMEQLGAKAATATGPAFDRIREQMTQIHALVEKGFEFGDLKADKTDGQLRSLRDKIMSELGITRKAADRIMATLFKDWRPQDNVKPKIDAAMADVDARINKMRANANHEIRFGDLQNGLVLAKIADTEARQAQLRAKLASNIAAGKLDNGPLVTKIAATGVKLDALRGKIKDPIVAGKVDTDNWMNSIAKAQKAFNVWKISLSGKLTVGNLVMPSPPATGYGGGGGPGAFGQRSDIVAAAESRVGDPYVWGGSSPGGFDCSGLMYWAYQHSGDHDFPRIPTYGGRQISRGNIQPADIMFYYPGSVQNGVRVPFGHFKMYAGNNQTVESTSGGVQVRPADWAGVAQIRSYLARGGITTGPSIAGEAGPEAVIPLTNARRGAAVMREAGLLPGGEGGTVVHEHYYIQLPGGSAIVGNAEDVGRQIAPAVGRRHAAEAAARARSR